MESHVGRPAGRAPLLAGARAGAFSLAALGLAVGFVRLLGIDGSLFLLQVEAYGLGSALTRGLPAARDLPGLLACVVGAGAVYGVVGLVSGAVVGTLAGALAPLRRLGAGRVAAAVVLGLGLGLELYWWTRPVVLPGLPATDPKRLAAAAVIVLVGLALGALIVAFLWRRCAGRRGAALTVAGVLVLGGLFVVLDGRRSTDLGRISERNRDLPNVLVVVVDALRQDTLGCYGDPRVHTPHIDRIAREGVMFERSLVHTPFTWPSFGSLLTGKVPRRHGLMKMAPGYVLPDNETLPTLLKGGVRADGTPLVAEDWVTGAFMTGTLSHGSGLLRGFDAYFEALVGHDLVDVHSRWSEFRSGLLPWLLANKVRQKLDRQLVVSETERWLRAHADRRFMALVHLYSTHTPYDPPADFRKKHLDPAYAGPFPAFYASHREAIEKGLYTPNEADIAQIRGLYLAGVEQADTDIGRILRTLEQLGTLDDTIVVVTSDHGESLGEHGLWEHNWMVQNNLLIPLVMRWPGDGAARGIPAGVRVPERMELSDVLPTLLALMGLQAPPAAETLEAEGARRDDARLLHALDGDDLTPLLRGTRGATRPFAFAENGTFLAVQDDRWKLIVRRELLADGVFEKVLQRAATGDEIAPDEASLGRPELFDLQSDPLELQNLFQAEPLHAKRLFDALAAQVARLPIRDEMVQKSARDIADEELFRALGYGGGVGD
jgi:arylsulfatase A-like enzyme